MNNLEKIKRMTEACTEFCDRFCKFPYEWNYEEDGDLYDSDLCNKACPINKMMELIINDDRR